MHLFINEAYADVYADDSTVHAANKDTIVVEYKLQNGAVRFWTWCRNNKMFIHFTKTSVMTIGTRYHTSCTDPISIIIDNEQIQNVESQKLLGVVIDRTLSRDKQIDSVCLNIITRITLLKLLSKYVDLVSLRQYYNSYILPMFYFWVHDMAPMYLPQHEQTIEIAKTYNSTSRHNKPFPANVPSIRTAPLS